MTTYIQKDQCEATQLENEWIILDADNFKITKINDIGGYCWSLLSQPQSLNSLLEAVSNEYNINEKEMIQQDLEQFLTKMMNCGLIQNAD